MKILKLRVSIVVVVLMMAAATGIIPTSLWASSEDPASVAGDPPVIQNAMIWNHGGRGDALLGDYYKLLISSTFDPPSGTTSFVAYVSIENVSSKWVAAFIRLRSATFGIEVARIPILLSPFDVFWFQIQPIADLAGNIVDVKIISTDENTLTRSGLPTDSGTYNVSVDLTLLNEFLLLPPFLKLASEATQGFIEVFGLFALDNLGAGTVADTATLPVIMNELWTGAGTGGIVAFNGQQARDVAQYLTGRVFLGDFNNGLYFGFPMRALRDWRTTATGTLHRDITAEVLSTGAYLRPGQGGQKQRNAGGALINPATIIYNTSGDPAYSDPDWATKFGPTWNDGDNYSDLAAAHYEVDAWGLAAVDNAVIKQNIQATYFNTGFSGNTYTLLALTFPTKYLHYLFDCAYGGLADNSGTCLGVADAKNRSSWPVGQTAAATQARNQLDLLLRLGGAEVTFRAWNQKENEPQDISSGATAVLPNNVSFIAVGDQSAARLAPWGFLVNTGTSPFDKVTAAADASGNTFKSGQFTISGFKLSGGTGVINDPRTTEFGGFTALTGHGAYDRSKYTLLDRLDSQTIPVSGEVMDFEFTNYAHARAFDPSWTNPAE
jgi:hypothetical protein